jgi:transcriptional regulator with XRE-family HTH domain
MALSASELGIGRRIRTARRQRRLTLEELGSATGLSKGFISHVERDLASPSVASLILICDALRIPIGSLFEGGDAKLVRAGDAPKVFLGGTEVEDFVLTPRSETRAQVIHTHLEPGGGGGDESYSIPVDVEFAYVVAGTLELHVDSEHYVLSQGDAITFSGREPHSWKNPSQDEPTDVLWLLVPAVH